MPDEGKVSSFRKTDYGYVLIDIAGQLDSGIGRMVIPTLLLEIMVLSIHPLYLLLRLHGVGKTTTMGLERGVMFLDPAKTDFPLLQRI